MARAPSAVHVAVASLNQTVGDWSGNRARIARACAEARARGAVVLALPEMAISGYSLGDRVWMQGTLDRSWASLVALLPEMRGLVVAVGLPIAHGGALLDAMAVVVDGRIVGLVPKENLATGDVEYENRWYAGWSRGRVETFAAPDGTEHPVGSLVFDVAGVGPFAVEVCEDGWKGVRPGSHAALAGARLVINASASWFILGKHAQRRRLVEEVSRQDRVAYLYTSLLGCDATRLIFDGSAFIGVDGRILAEGPRFVFTDDVVVTDAVVDLAAVDRGRRTEGSWRAQEEALADGDYGRPPQRIRVDAALPVRALPPDPVAYWEPVAATSVDPSLDHHAAFRGVAPDALHHVELELALCMGLRDYLAKTGVRGVALALSGGRDSAMCAVLVARMLRHAHPQDDDATHRQRVHDTLLTAYLATGHSGSATREAARRLAEGLGAEHVDVGIQEAVDVHRGLAEAALGRALDWADATDDLALQNVQARLRGSLIWMLANVRGRLLLTTSNKSEAAVGYTTMDGDTSGGLGPLADVPKSLIGAWLGWAAAQHGITGLDAVLATPATAELRPPDRAQTDEGDLMPFAILDRLMYRFAYLGEEPAEMLRRLWPGVRDRYDGDVLAFATHIRRFVTLFCRAQWKRERLAISFRVTAFDLDPKTGFRFPAVQAPFTEELAEMDAEAARLASEPSDT